MTSPPVALKTVDLSKTFAAGRRLIGPPRARVHALHPVSLEVRRGETLGVVGESGCGKSTLAKMLVGLLPPSGGRIEIEGRSVAGAGRADFARLIQYVFQDPVSSLNPRKSVRRIMEAPLRRLHGLSGSELSERILELFAAVGLRAEFLSRYPHEFSGGQAQRIGIARALAADPRILVLDEPVSALDVSIQAQVINLLGELREDFGLTYFFISHDLAVVEAVSDRVAVLYFGSLVELGLARDIFSLPRHPYTRLLSESAPVVGRAIGGAVSGEIPDPLDPPAGCAFAGRCPRASEVCRGEVPRLRAVGDSFVACHHPLDP